MTAPRRVRSRDCDCGPVGIGRIVTDGGPSLSDGVPVVVAICSSARSESGEPHADAARIRIVTVRAMVTGFRMGCLGVRL
jgi:hypothetical protein